MRKLLLIAAALVLGINTNAHAGSVYLLGTDAVSLHADSVFGAQLFGNVDSPAGPPTLPVLVLNNFGGGGGGYAGSGDGFTFTSTLSGYNLNNYSALFVASLGRCCSDGGGQIAGFESSISSYLGGGGNLIVEDFLGSFGNHFWDSILGFDPNGGLVSGTSGSDSDNATPAGMALGFTGNVAGGPGQYSDFSFGHQMYSGSFFAAHGFATLISTDSGNAVVLSNASVTPVPEPASLTLFGSGLLLAARRWRQRKSATTTV